MGSTGADVIASLLLDLKKFIIILITKFENLIVS